MNDTINLPQSHRSIRSYSDAPISDFHKTDLGVRKAGTIERQISKIAMEAP